ncbi:hypothetical protein ACS0PU_008698 [Formica fusca]
MIPVKRANWPVHYIESDGQSATSKGSLLCEIEIAMSRARNGPRGREKSDRLPFSLSDERDRSTPIPRPHNNSHHAATKAKHPKYWRKSRHSLSRLARGTGRGGHGSGPTKYLSRI